MAIRIYTLNQHALDIIDNDKKAYFLGFFFADGYNCEQKGFLRIALHHQDEYLLEFFKETLSSNHKIYTLEPNISQKRPNIIKILHICSKKLSIALANYGATQNKSLTLRFPFKISTEFWRSFVRGYFDGDGSCIKSNKQYAIHFACSHVFAKELQSILYRTTNLQFKITITGKISILWLGGNRQAEKFLDWLYHGSQQHLTRKYTRYQELKNTNLQTDANKTYVFFARERGHWVGRLPLKFGRKSVGKVFETRKEAEEAVKAKILQLTS